MPRDALWTDADWRDLISLVRSEAPVSLSDEQIREAAFNYIRVGPDGGGNKWGLEGTLVAFCVDKIRQR